MRDSLRALSNEIVARDQNSVVSPISFMRDYSRLHSPPLCPHSHTETHSVYPSFSLYQLKESQSFSHAERETQPGGHESQYDTWW